MGQMKYQPIKYKSMRQFVKEVILCNNIKQHNIIKNKKIIHGEIMALDVGTRYTGIAVSMRQCKFPRSIETLKHYNNQRLRDSKDKILHLIKTHNIKSLVVGWPINYDDIEPEGKQCRFVLNNILELCKTDKQFNEMPILLQDETNTTKDVLDSGIQSILGKNIKEKGIIDQMVAINLLNSVLIKVQDELYIPR